MAGTLTVIPLCNKKGKEHHPQTGSEAIFMSPSHLFYIAVLVMILIIYQLGIPLTENLKEELPFIFCSPGFLPGYSFPFQYTCRSEHR